MERNRKLQLCYLPTYSITADYKITYLNTRSLHKHINDVKHNHNLLASDVIILAETRLKMQDRDEHYNISGYSQMIRLDQQQHGKNRPAHGLITYVKDGIQLMDICKYSTPHFEALLVCVLKTGCYIPTQIIGIYISPQASWQEVTQHLHRLVEKIDMISTRTVVLGDCNMKSVTKKKEEYNTQLEMYMEQLVNMTQHVKEFTTSENSILDLCFAHNIERITTCWNHWSDHKSLTVALNL